MFYTSSRRKPKHRKSHVKHTRKGHKYGRHQNPDFKLMALAGAAGIATILAGNELVKRVDFFQKNWYAIPAAALVGGAFLLKRMPTIGVSVAAIGGALGYLAYQAKPAAQTSGFMDAGYWMQGRSLGPQMRRDSGLFERSNAGALMGAAADASIRSQAGALLGAASHTVKRDQATGMGNAGSIYASAMGLEA
jgi:hypothetical protein